MTRLSLISIICAAAALSACATAPQTMPAPLPVVQPTPIKTCFSRSELQRVVIPAVTKKVIAITEIENPPYEPIQRREEQTRVVTPEYVYYVDETGAEVTKFCESNG